MKTVFTLNVIQVEGLVQGDSRIDQYPKVVNGESRIVWEWQGNCFLLELISDWLNYGQGINKNIFEWYFL